MTKFKDKHFAALTPGANLDGIRGVVLQYDSSVMVMGDPTNTFPQFVALDDLISTLTTQEVTPVVTPPGATTSKLDYHAVRDFNNRDRDGIGETRVDEGVKKARELLSGQRTGAEGSGRRNYSNWCTGQEVTVPSVVISFASLRSDSGLPLFKELLYSDVIPEFKNNDDFWGSGDVCRFSVGLGPFAFASSDLSAQDPVRYQYTTNELNVLAGKSFPATQLDGTTVAGWTNGSNTARVRWLWLHSYPVMATPPCRSLYSSLQLQVWRKLNLGRTGPSLARALCWRVLAATWVYDVDMHTHPLHVASSCVFLSHNPSVAPLFCGK